MAVLRGRERKGDAIGTRDDDGRERGAKGGDARAATGGGVEGASGRWGDAATGVRRVDARRRRATRREGVVRRVRRGGEERDVGRGECGADERGARGGGGGGERAAE